MNLPTGSATDWLEVAMTVNGELAEAVAEVLARYSTGGVTMEQAVRHLDDNDVGTPYGPITVRAYLPVDGSEQQARQSIEAAIRYLGMIQSLPEPQFKIIQDQNWMEAWRAHYRPIPIGKRLMVVPAWSDTDSLDRVPIRIDPGMAFGTGTHPSTQLCLELIDDLLAGDDRSHPRATLHSPAGFIDIGCGSGILAIAAIKLGVVSALGVDIDPVAIQNARENAALNDIGKELILGVGSVDAVLDGRFGVSSAPLVAANILAPVIVELLGSGLDRTVQPGGSLILAGILESQAEVVEAATRRAGLAIEARRQSGDWIALSASH